MHKKSVELLNQAVGDELASVHQYMYWHFHCDDQGFDLLAGLFKRTAIEEMLHIERLAERILFLKGDVEMTARARSRRSTDVEKMLKMAAGMEEKSAQDYNRMALECAQNADSQSQAALRGTRGRRGAAFRPVRHRAREHGTVRQGVPGPAEHRAGKDPWIANDGRLVSSLRQRSMDLKGDPCES